MGILILGRLGYSVVTDSLPGTAGYQVEADEGCSLIGTPCESGQAPRV